MTLIQISHEIQTLLGNPYLWNPEGNEIFVAFDDVPKAKNAAMKKLLKRCRWNLSDKGIVIR